MIYHFKSLVLVRKGRAFYTTLYQEVFFRNPGCGGSLSYLQVTHTHFTSWIQPNRLNSASPPLHQESENSVKRQSLIPGDLGELGELSSCYVLISILIMLSFILYFIFRLCISFFT